MTDVEMGKPEVAPVAPVASTEKITLKVFKWKYLFIIAGIVVVANLVNSFIPAASWVLVGIGFVLALMDVDKIKKNPEIARTEVANAKAVAIMTLNPLIGQAVYYYSLRKTLPDLAKGYNNLGWKTIGAMFLVGIVVVTLLSVLFSVFKIFTV